jgi:molybdate transport system substrate-binding protein
MKIRARAVLRTSLVWNLSVFLSSMGLVGFTQLRAQEVLVAAASDLAPAIPALTQEVQRNLKLSIRVSAGSSGQLARQIEQGAPFDLFLSADENFAAQVVRAGRADGAAAQVYATGRLALWSKSGSVRRIEDLARPEIQRVAIANPGVAPYGRLAKEALERAGLWVAVQPKLVYAESARQTMQYAATGNVDAALTPWTLVHDKGGILLPDTLRQTGVVIKGAKNAAGARAVLDFLRASGGNGVLWRHGLLPVDAAGQPLAQNLQHHDGDGKNGGADKQAKKPERLRPAKKRNKNQ